MHPTYLDPNPRVQRAIQNWRSSLVKHATDERALVQIAPVGDVREDRRDDVHGEVFWPVDRRRCGHGRVQHGTIAKRERNEKEDGEQESRESRDDRKREQEICCANIMGLVLVRRQVDLADPVSWTLWI